MKHSVPSGRSLHQVCVVSRINEHPTQVACGCPGPNGWAIRCASSFAVTSGESTLPQPPPSSTGGLDAFSCPDQRPALATNRKPAVCASALIRVNLPPKCSSENPRMSLQCLEPNVKFDNGKGAHRFSFYGPSPKRKRTREADHSSIRGTEEEGGNMAGRCTIGLIGRLAQDMEGRQTGRTDARGASGTDRAGNRALSTGKSGEPS